MLRTTLALLLVTTSVAAAPVPPPPRLSDELLVGLWDYEWTARSGFTLRGRIELRPDGTQSSVTAGGTYFHGVWWVDGGQLVLIDGDGDGRYPHTWVYVLDPVTLRGRTAGGDEIRLTNRR